MAKLNDLTGKTFGNWKVLYRNGSTKNKAAIWHCKCLLCDSEHDVVGASLTSGASTKCRACVPRETLTMPYKNDPIRHVFSGMWQRCYDKNHKGYDRYGGRGIAICDEWLEDRQKFYDWAYANGYGSGMSIERIDIDKGYSPDNCTFIPLSEQSKNRSTSILVEIDGTTKTVADWCKTLGLTYGCVYSRIYRGMTPYQALTK